MATKTYAGYQYGGSSEAKRQMIIKDDDEEETEDAEDWEIALERVNEENKGK